jgi:serine/threonine protein kinase/tetratricopeptide (TPR) repeat protein
VIEAPWEKVRDLLDSSLELPQPQRSKYLDEHCPDPQVRRSVEALIESYEECATFLEKPAISNFSEHDPSWSGRWLGPYKLLDEIGAGGMGRVYRAVRADNEYNQNVAIKIISGVFVSKQLVNRFRAERQILASLNHPNVARLLDGGTTKEGLPYLVMEFVEGTPIDEYCDAHRLPLRKRLELFVQLCSAVQYAHQNLIVHRDLKPGSILVTRDGTAKLLDFGIAKILQPVGQGIGREQTATLQPMTPGYASPEQLENKPVTTASDVYSLGVVLYLLLTGHRRYLKSLGSAHDRAQANASEAPIRPSVAIGRTESIAGGDKHTAIATIVKDRQAQSIDRLRRELTGDLDAIVLKSLEKDCARRYRFAEQFADDIRRYLEGQPVQACLPTLRYRAAKFVRRNIVAVTAATIVAIAAITALGLIIRAERIANKQRARAEARFNDVRKLANSLLFDVHDSIQNLPGSTPARELIVKKALEYLDSLAKEAANDVTLQRELGTAYEKVGDVQGQFYAENLGLPQAALESYKKALAIRTALVRVEPRDVENQRQLAAIDGKLGNIEWITGDPKAAAESSRRGLEVSQAVSAASPSNRSDRKLLATSYLDYGWKQGAGEGDYAAGIASCHRAITILEDLLRQDAADKDARTSLTTAYSRLGTFLESSGRFPEALSVFQMAFALREKLFASDPTNTKNRRYLASSHINIGNVLAEMNDPRGALLHQQKALAMMESLSAEDPQNVQLRQDRAGVLGNIGSQLTVIGNENAAEHSLQQAIGLLLSLPAANSSVVIRFTVAKDQYRLGKALASRAAKTPNSALSRERWREARTWFEKSLPAFIDLRDRKIAAGPDAAMPDEVLKEVFNCDKALHATPVHLNHHGQPQALSIQH